MFVQYRSTMATLVGWDMLIIPVIDFLPGPSWLSTGLHELFTMQPTTLPDHPPVSPFLEPRSLIISCSSTVLYPSLHHVFRINYHLNFAPFIYLPPPSTLPIIIFIQLFYLLPRLSTQN